LRVEVQKLQLFEQQARQEKIGAWGVNVGRLNGRAQQSPAFSSFAPDQKIWSRSPRAESSAVVSPSPKPDAFSARSNPFETKKTRAKEKTPLGKIGINTATEKELTTVPGIVSQC
jgi:DNA uptake protein ComE-like DNA-binding protein